MSKSFQERPTIFLSGSEFAAEEIFCSNACFTSNCFSGQVKCFFQSPPDKSFCLTSEGNSVHISKTFKNVDSQKKAFLISFFWTSNIRFEQPCSRKFPMKSKVFRSSSETFRRRLFCPKRQKFSNCSSEHVKWNNVVSAENYCEKAETFLLQIRKKKCNKL